MPTLNPIRGDLLAGVAGQSLDNITAEDTSLVTGDAPAQSWMLLPAAAGQTFVARQVVGFNATSKLVPATFAGTPSVAATGVLTFTGVGTEGDTVTIGDRVYTLSATVATPNTVLIGGTATETAANLVAAINGAAGAGTTYGASTQDHAAVTASSAAAVLTVTSRIGGIGGNSVVTTEAGSSASFGAATLTGGSGSVTTGVRAIGYVTYAPTGVTTLDQMIGVMRQGVFNPDLLVFDDSYGTAEQQRLAFEGAPSPTSIILRTPATMTAV